MEKIESRPGKCYYVYKNFKYYVDKRNETIYRCANKTRGKVPGCPGVLIKTDNSIYIKTAHTHKKNYYEESSEEEKEQKDLESELHNEVEQAEEIKSTSQGTTKDTNKQKIQELEEIIKKHEEEIKELHDDKEIMNKKLNSAINKIATLETQLKKVKKNSKGIQPGIVT
ncbi:PREDICTED: uncharacterized protein LOC108775576 isoform X1 [Cyphomyrmex costatus]|uniref:uncharacterized protein LOC108775576 isoform X1 n=1 Tax=Cyphomyrmex costatus TaxID=456900 RepID=UPI0008523CED|nr:PREDICTED: uncharacterized protein LOC108775576 isoform X1 [Cyphomyrmex costatus]